MIALVGLHDLKECSARYYEAIYAWRPVHISFLSPNDVADVLQVEDDSFPLAYSPEAIARVHHLTGGQPFPGQLLGDGLVQDFNRRPREEVRLPPSTIAERDVEGLVAAGTLYRDGEVYFRWIWQQAGAEPPGQHALLQAPSAHPEGLDATELPRACDLPEAELGAARDALGRHDVLIDNGGHFRFSVELMRLWVQAVQL